MVAKFSVAAIPVVIDENNYASFSKDELVSHPRRSLRQTPMKETTDEFVTSMYFVLLTCKCSKFKHSPTPYIILNLVCF